MSPVRIEKPRKLVLARETVRTLATPKGFLLTIEAERQTSCGEVCTCACEETY